MTTATIKTANHWEEGLRPLIMLTCCRVRRCAEGVPVARCGRCGQVPGPNGPVRLDDHQ